MRTSFRLFTRSIAGKKKSKPDPETAGEVMVYFKTIQDRQAAFEEKLRSLHPYEIPEIIFVKIGGGFPDYLRWVINNCR